MSILHALKSHTVLLWPCWDSYKILFFYAQYWLLLRNFCVEYCFLMRFPNLHFWCHEFYPRIFLPCNLVSSFQLLQFSPLHWLWCHDFQSRIFQPRIFELTLQCFQSPARKLGPWSVCYDIRQQSTILCTPTWCHLDVGMGCGKSFYVETSCPQTSEVQTHDIFSFSAKTR